MVTVLLYSHKIMDLCQIFYSCILLSVGAANYSLQCMRKGREDGTFLSQRGALPLFHPLPFGAMSVNLLDK